MLTNDHRLNTEQVSGQNTTATACFYVSSYYYYYYYSQLSLGENG